MADYTYYKTIFQGIEKPFAFVDLDLFDQNIAAILQRAANKNIRIATKSVRCVALLRRILEADSRFQGLMVYSAQEAHFLAMQGFDDLLLGYPVYDSFHIQLLAGHIRKGKRITLMIDSVAHLEQIQRIGEDYQVQVPVCIDIDMSSDYFGGKLHFGVWRSSLRTIKQLNPLLETLQHCRNIVVEGVMGYEAQIAGLGDAVPNKWMLNRLVRWLKQDSIKQLRKRRKVLVDKMSEYFPLRFVNGGGTGSLETTAAEDCVTELTAGSGFFSPHLFDNYTHFRHQPAAAYAIEIVRQPRSDLFTCLGGGYVASGATDGSKSPKVYLPKGAKLMENEGAGEVQTPVWYSGAEELALGDPIFLRHSKAGELCEHFQKLYLVRQGSIAGEALTYRGEGQCFL